MNLEIRILKKSNLIFSFPGNLQFGQKIKTIKGYWWHLEGKYWSFQNIDYETKLPSEKVRREYDNI